MLLLVIFRRHLRKSRLENFNTTYVTVSLCACFYHPACPVISIQLMLLLVVPASPAIDKPSDFNTTYVTVSPCSQRVDWSGLRFQYNLCYC